MKRLTIALITILCMGSSLPVLKQDIRDVNGSGLSGALMYFYEAGTSTPYDTWSDEALTSANANPVVADGNGFFGEIYLDPDQTYKVVVKTSSGSTIYSVDNINAVQLTSSSLAARLKQVASNPIDWGAAGDGTTDDCAGDNDIQQAIDNATGVVDLLGLTYRCDSSISLASGITLKNGTIDFSNSSDAVLVDVSGTMGTGVDLSSNATYGYGGITVDSASGLSVGDWLLIYSSDAVYSGEMVLITAIAGTSLTLDRPLFGSYTTANNAQIKKVTPVQDVTIDNVVFLHSESAAGTPVVVRMDACANITMVNSKIDTFSDAAINILTCADVTIDGVTIENGTPYGITICDGARDTMITNTSILDVSLFAITSCAVGTRREGFTTNTFVADSILEGSSRSVYMTGRSYGITVRDSYLSSSIYTNDDAVQRVNNKIIGNTIASGIFLATGTSTVEGNSITAQSFTVTPDDNDFLVVADNVFDMTSPSGPDITLAATSVVSNNSVDRVDTTTAITLAAGNQTISGNSLTHLSISGSTATNLTLTGNSIVSSVAPTALFAVTGASTTLVMSGNLVDGTTSSTASIDTASASLSGDHFDADLSFGNMPIITIDNIYVSDDFAMSWDSDYITIEDSYIVGDAALYGREDVVVNNNIIGGATTLSTCAGGSTYNTTMGGNSFRGNVTINNDCGSGITTFGSNAVLGKLSVTANGYVTITDNVIDATDAAPNITLAHYAAGTYYATVTNNILIDGTYGISAATVDDDMVSWGNQFISMTTGDISGEVPVAIHYYGSTSTPTGSSDQPGTGGDTNWHEMTGCDNGDADLKGFTESDCDLVSTYGGTYLIGYSASFSGHNTESYVFGVSMGNPADVVPETGCYSTIYLDSANDFNIAGNCILAPSAGDTLRLITKSVGGGATEMSVDSLTFTATQL